MMIILISMCNQMVLSLSGTWLVRYSLYFVHYQVVSAPLPVPALHQMLAIFILKPRFWRENVLSVRNLENCNNNDIWWFFILLNRYCYLFIMNLKCSNDGPQYSFF